MTGIAAVMFQGSEWVLSYAADAARSASAAADSATPVSPARRALFADCAWSRAASRLSFASYAVYPSHATKPPTTSVVAVIATAVLRLRRKAAAPLVSRSGPLGGMVLEPLGSAPESSSDFGPTVSLFIR